MDENNSQFNPGEMQPYPTQPEQSQSYSSYQPQPPSINLPFLKSFIGWATFRAIMDIIFGSLSCLGIITAVYGVPMIIAGVRLLNAIDQLKMYVATNDLKRVEDTFNSLSKFFKLNGIATIIKIILAIILIILYVTFIIYLFNNIGNFDFAPIPNLDEYYKYEYSF